ncbi:MAG TPA: NADP-dependent oxidoreductase [Nevskiaceae bacterium]|nr:NADP-dependent oxidoreductase [Nevskiaceae bacterium]
MAQSADRNRRFVLAQHPKGDIDERTFRLETAPVPKPGPGQALLRTQWLSLDPYMRVRIYEEDTYMPSVKLGEVMVGGTVSRVEASNHPDLKVGDVVHTYAGWQDYSLTDGSDVVVKLPEGFAKPSWYLGPLGMPGFTAWHALMNIGRPKKGETFVTAAATGAVGQMVGQIAKRQGLRVVGIAGGKAKCDYAVRELGFDVCVDHSARDFPERLRAACPKGIDIYLENVGGPVLDAVRPLLNLYARVPICGFIAHYSGEQTSAEDRLPAVLGEILFKRLDVKGFVIFDAYPEFYAGFVKEMTPLVESGEVKVREHVVDTLEGAPKALAELLRGGNFGKVVVRIEA